MLTATSPSLHTMSMSALVSISVMPVPCSFRAGSVVACDGGGCLLVADGQAADRVEEVQVRGVHGELDGAARAHRTAGRDPGRPQRLAARERDGGLVVILVALGGLGDAGV